MKLFGYSFKASNSYTRGPAAFPRTPSLVFQPPTTLPFVRVTGAGTPVQKQLRVCQGPQINFRQAVPLAGYGGISAGMLYGYPLAQNGLGQPLGTPPVS